MRRRGWIGGGCFGGLWLAWLCGWVIDGASGALFAACVCGGLRLAFWELGGSLLRVRTSQKGTGRGHADVTLDFSILRNSLLRNVTGLISSVT